MPPEKGYRYAQPITHFYCRPCGEYHHKEHPHYEEMKQRAAERERNAPRAKPKKAAKT